MATAEEITRHHEPDPDRSPWIGGPPPPETISVIAYDDGWPERFETLAASIVGALGSEVVAVEHVGSTAVPGLAAKDVIDIDVIVADPAAEDRYVPALEGLGYVLFAREPWWHEHRLLRLAEPRANVHVFGPDCPEHIRHLMFRDWLRENRDDRELYAEAKRIAAPGVGGVMDYNARKQDVVREIYHRMFVAAGLLSR
jgi:GrpB-like predicted nucleotidyltransferase (UPF0157 family)